MNGLIKTVFIICMLIILVQTVRHIYARFTYDRPSVLSKYDEGKTHKYIKGALSLDSLLIKYDVALNNVKVFEKDKTKKEMDSLRMQADTLYENSSNYREAIEDWEAKEHKIHEAIVFWVVGFVLIVIGTFLYFKNLKWLGLSLTLPGLVEMIWWSSPDLTLDGATLEFIKFLNVKLILSFITLVLLVLGWHLYKLDQNESHK